MMQTKFSEISEKKQLSIRADIRRYLVGEIKMKDIAIKHNVATYITQKLLRTELGYNTKDNQLKTN